MSYQDNSDSNNTSNDNVSAVEEKKLSDFIESNNSSLLKLVSNPFGTPFLPELCYQVGDVGPAGGTIVSTPFVNMNFTSFYYEVAPEKAATMNDVYGGGNAHSFNYSGVTYSGSGTCNPLPPHVEFGLVTNTGSCSPNMPPTLSNVDPISTIPYTTAMIRQDIRTRLHFGAGFMNTYAYSYIQPATGVWQTTTHNVYQYSNDVLQAPYAGTIPTFHSNSLNAFDACKNYTLNGFDDWFLPSAHELEEIRNQVPSVLNPGEWYWSSTSGMWAGSGHAFNVDINNSFGTWDGVTNTYVYNTDNNTALGDITAFACTDTQWGLLPRSSTCSALPLRRFLCGSSPQYVQNCFEIGDKGPGGGMIFALPYTGWNQTKYYYEITTKDLSTGGTPHTHFQGIPAPPLPFSAKCDTTSATGAEFGVDSLSINTSLDFGYGHDNTDTINSYPSGLGVSPANPTIDTHDIAARLCAGYTANNYTDWFLPSAHELQWAWNMLNPANTVVPGGNINWSTDTVNTERIYWTSSTENIQADDRAWVLDSLTGGITYSGRCYPHSVRAVRRFECEDEGLTYDYRLVKSSNMSPGGMHITMSHNGSSYQSPIAQVSDNIGGEWMHVSAHKMDVRQNPIFGKANTYAYWPWLGHDVVFSIYTQEENLIGRWKYKSFGYYMCGSANCRMNQVFQLVDDYGYGRVNLTNVMHPNGSYASSNMSPGYGSWGASVGEKGSAYIRLDWEDSSTPWGPNWTYGANGRGNTKNLEDYIGTGQNHRTTASNPLPTGVGVYGYDWKYTCRGCGIYGSYTFPNNYRRYGCNPWMSELPPPTPLGNVNLPSYGPPTLYDSYDDCYTKAEGGNPCYGYVPSATDDNVQSLLSPTDCGDNEYPPLETKESELVTIKTIPRRKYR